MKSGHLVIIVALVSVLTVSANSQGRRPTITIKGQLDCGEWVSARNDKTAMPLEHYLLGVLNGLSMASGSDFWTARGRDTSRDAANLWMDNYCHQHPLESFNTGAFELFKEQSGWKPNFK